MKRTSKDDRNRRSKTIPLTKGASREQQAGGFVTLRADGDELDVRFHEGKDHREVGDLLDAHVSGELHAPVGLHRLP